MVSQRALWKSLWLSQHLQDAVGAPVPHRPIRWGPANQKERVEAAATILNSFVHQDDWLGRLHDVRFEDLPPTDHVPMILVEGRPVAVIAHLFSGRRRAGDFHDWLQCWAAEAPFGILVLSLDTAINETYGNLFFRSTSWLTLLRCYEAGLIAASLCGPPCET